MTAEIQEIIVRKTKLKLGINKISELSRLVYEIGRREKISFEDILSGPEISFLLDDKGAGYLARFARLKKYLLRRRYPNASKNADLSVYFSRMKFPREGVKVYDGKFVPERIFIEREAEKYPLAKRVKDVFGIDKCQSIESLKGYRKDNASSPFDPKKRDLFIAAERWDFVKPCPCTKNAVHCGYSIINLGFGCPYDCSYCYLQQYSNFSGITLPANICEYFPKIDSYLKKFNGRRVRLGTGEFSDSLALDDITGYSKELVPYFKTQNAVLELKTKSANVANLAGLEHGGNTVISWSLNPNKLAETEELGAASLRERLTAAKICSEAGYGIGFHFDPVIYYDGWEKDYEGVIDEMYQAVPAPAWISIGALRFHRTLKDVIEARFPKSDHIYGELTLGIDKKMRYYDLIRKDIFDKMNGWIRKRSQKTLVYLCMENADMWKRTYGRASAQFFREDN